MNQIDLRSLNLRQPFPPNSTIAPPRALADEVEKRCRDHDWEDVTITYPVACSIVATLRSLARTCEDWQRNSYEQNQAIAAIRRQPFRPFTLVLTDGRSFTVDHPDFVAISRNGREVTFYGEDDIQHFLDARLIAEVVTSQETAPAP